MIGGPDVAVEVVSPESSHRDYFEKKLLYEAAGVLEYWILDPLQSRAEFYRLEDGNYRLVALEPNRIFHSQAIAVSGSMWNGYSLKNCLMSSKCFSRS